MTFALQTLVQIINFLFKKYLKNKFWEFLIFDFNNKETLQELEKGLK